MAFCEKFGVMAGFAFTLLICGMSILWKIMFDISKRMSAIEQDLAKINVVITSVERDLSVLSIKTIAMNRETYGLSDLISNLRSDIKDVSSIVTMKRRDLEDKLKGARKSVNLENSFDMPKDPVPLDYD